MAEVFKACYYQEDDKLAFAAIKRILPNLAQDQSFVDMFISEAQMASKLQHPGIGQIIEQGCEKGEYYIAMEYIAGKDLLYLRHHLKDKGAHFSPALSAYVIACIAEALDYAHFKTDESGQLMGLIHRDISPQNILISYDGDVKLIDFGIAKAKDRSQESTRAGVLKGKFGYMSPEQLLGKGQVNHRLDIFSLGVVFYELLTNRRLFYGESDLETLELVRAAKIEPPSLKHPWISKTLDQIILKALAKNPNERYQRAADMGVDLRRFLEAEAPNINKSQLKNWMYQEFGNLIANERAQESYLIDQLKTASQDDSDSTVLNMNKFDFQLVQTPQPFANPNFQQNQAYMQQGYGGQGQFYSPTQSQYPPSIQASTQGTRSPIMQTMQGQAIVQATPLALRSTPTPQPIGMPQNLPHPSHLSPPAQYNQQGNAQHEAIYQEKTFEVTFENSMSFDLELPHLPTANLMPKVDMQQSQNPSFQNAQSPNTSIHEQNTPITPLEVSPKIKRFQALAIFALSLFSLTVFFYYNQSKNYELTLKTSHLPPNTSLKIGDQVFPLVDAQQKLSFPSQSYQVEITAPAHQSFSHHISLNQNQTLEFELKALDLVEVYVHIVSTPKDAEVIYQGKSLGKTPLQKKIWISNQKHNEIIFKLKNHVLDKQNIVFKPNKTEYKIYKTMTRIQ